MAVIDAYHKIKYIDSSGGIYLNDTINPTGLDSNWRVLDGGAAYWSPFLSMIHTSLTDPFDGILSLNRAGLNWKIKATINAQDNLGQYNTWQFGISVSGAAPTAESYEIQNHGPGNPETQCICFTDILQASQFTWLRIMVRRLGGTGTSIRIVNAAIEAIGH